MSLGTILVIILIIFLLGGFSGRFGVTATATATPEWPGRRHSGRAARSVLLGKL